MDWLALWAEFAQAIDNEQLEVAERIITDYSGDHGTNRPGHRNASPNTLHLTIFHDERQQGGRDHDPGQDLHKANRMAAIAHDGQKNHSGQDTTGLD